MAERKSSCGGCAGIVVIIIVIGAIGSAFTAHNLPAPNPSQAPPAPNPVQTTTAPTVPAVVPAPPPAPQPQPDAASLASFVHEVHDNYGMITLADGTTFLNVTVTKYDPTGVTLIHDAGGENIPFERFSDKPTPPDIRKKYNYDPALAAAYRKAQADLQAANDAQAAKDAQAKADADRPKREVEAFKAALATAGIDSSLVDSFSVQGDELTIRVTSLYHQIDYQTRLQGAQNFEKVWTMIHGEHAFLSITDLNGNEVGGTGFTGVWAQKEN
jgi:hypothetical protein